MLGLLQNDRSCYYIGTKIADFFNNMHVLLFQYNINVTVNISLYETLT